jgi:hypothetical protein
MLKDLNSVEEIKEFFNNLEEKPMADMHKARIYGMAQSYQEQEEKLNPIREYYEKDKNRKVIDIFSLGDEYQFVKYKILINREEKETLWTAFINYKPIDMSTHTLEEIMIIAIAEKYEGSNSKAGYYFAKMIGLRE